MKVKTSYKVHRIPLDAFVKKILVNKSSQLRIYDDLMCHS